MIYNKALSSNVETTLNANLKEEITMTNKNNKMVANVEQNIIGGVNMERVFNEELASIIAEVVEHEKKMEEEVEMKRSLEEEIAKIVDELERIDEMKTNKPARERKMKKDNKRFDRMVEREEKKAMFKAKVSGFFGMAKQTAVVAKDKVASTVDNKVEDFFAKDELKKEDYAEQVEEVEEVDEVDEVDEELEVLIDGLREELEKEAALKAELEEINKMREEIRLEMELATDLREQKEGKKELSVEDKLKQEIEGLKAQIAFEESKQEALLAGVKESDVLNTKEDIDAYFMGQ